MMLQTALKEGTCLIRSANICSWSLAAACADSFRWRMGKALRLLESNSGRNSGDFGLYFAEVGGALFAVDEPMNVVRTRTRKKKKLKRSWSEDESDVLKYETRMANMESGQATFMRGWNSIRKSFPNPDSWCPLP
jgi:hypothetical protein